DHFLRLAVAVGPVVDFEQAGGRAGDAGGQVADVHVSVDDASGTDDIRTARYPGHIQRFGVGHGVGLQVGSGEQFDEIASLTGNDQGVVTVEIGAAGELSAEIARFGVAGG